MRHIRLLAGVGALSLLASLIALIPARVALSALSGADSGASGLAFVTSEVLERISELLSSSRAGCPPYPRGS